MAGTLRRAHMRTTAAAGGASKKGERLRGVGEARGQ